MSTQHSMHPEHGSDSFRSDFTLWRREERYPERDYVSVTIRSGLNGATTFHGDPGDLRRIAKTFTDAADALDRVLAEARGHAPAVAVPPRCETEPLCPMCKAAADAVQAIPNRLHPLSAGVSSPGSDTPSGPGCPPAADGGAP